MLLATVLVHHNHTSHTLVSHCLWSLYWNMFLSKEKEEAKRRKREYLCVDHFWSRECWCDLVCGSSTGHWTWKMRRQRWPWLEVCLADCFMSVFRCVFVCACRWRQGAVAGRRLINLAVHTHSVIIIVWAKPRTRRNRVDLSCVCLYNPKTCASGQGQGSPYTNIPTEIEYKQAPGPLGTSD